MALKWSFCQDLILIEMTAGVGVVVKVIPTDRESDMKIDWKYNQLWTDQKWPPSYAFLCFASLFIDFWKNAVEKYRH